MTEELLVLAVGGVLIAAWSWAVRAFPKERWQIIATVPRRKGEDGSWQGTNLTFYGLLTATSAILALATFLVLAGSIGVGVGQLLVLFALITATCLPAAKLLARLIEGKAHTFSIAGASFVGVLVAPLGMVALNALAEPDRHVPIVATFAAYSIAYVFGEGLGRLGCISFGCCYGKPLTLLGEHSKRLFDRFHVEFQGSTKKIAYASGMEGVKVVPVQAVTSLLYFGLATVGTLFFLNGAFGVALVATLGLSHLWRAYSETLRADHRGGGRITVYQWMALATAGFAAAAAGLLPSEPQLAASLGRGLHVLWSPAMILLLEASWLAMFLYSGWSMVTGSVLSFHVNRDRI